MSIDLESRARAFVAILGRLVPDHRSVADAFLERRDIFVYAYGAKTGHAKHDLRFKGKRQRAIAEELARACPLGESPRVLVQQLFDLAEPREDAFAAIVSDEFGAAVAAYSVQHRVTISRVVGASSQPVVASSGAARKLGTPLVELLRMARGELDAFEARIDEMPPSIHEAIAAMPLGIVEYDSTSLVVAALARGLGLAVKNEFGKSTWKVPFGGGMPTAMFATNEARVDDWLAGLTPRTEKRPGDPCPRCSAKLIDVGANQSHCGHPGGGDYDFVGSGPVSLMCEGCGAKLETNLRRTYWVETGKLTYE